MLPDLLSAIYISQRTDFVKGIFPIPRFFPSAANPLT
jgi:hypothetical protein